MRNLSQRWRILVAFFLLGFLSLPPYLQAHNKIKSKVFLSPKFELGPGSVENKVYPDIDFPRGHIAIKSFNAEVIDEAGNPVPLHETYLHHWAVGRFYGNPQSENILVKNDGICYSDVLWQYFGIGSETRRTATHIPDPYGIEVGNPATIPAGYEDVWMLNVHAIDTRGVEDELRCTECKCDLYNVTVDEYGQPLSPNYRGGLKCCYDHTKCRVKHDFEGDSSKRNLYMRYTVKWVDWDTSVVPVKIYILDVTDDEERFYDSTGLNSVQHHCLVEYDIEPCNKAKGGGGDDECVHTKRTSLTMPADGYIIYGVAHQHSGGIGAAIYRKDGQHICSSFPTYGNGKEVGNEAGYIVGMSTCYQKPDSLKIANGEALILESNYSSYREHTGVMGLFYILVADRQAQELNSSTKVSVKVYKIIHHSDFVLGAIVFVVVVVAVALSSRLSRYMHNGYQPILT